MTKTLHVLQEFCGDDERPDNSEQKRRTCVRKTSRVKKRASENATKENNVKKKRDEENLYFSLNAAVGYVIL